MKEPLDRSHEINSTTPDFQKQIDAITNRALTPESIDTYADEALDDLIAIVGKVTAGYTQQEASCRSGKEIERLSFAHYGLNANTIERSLDHIADLVADIGALDEFIEQYANNGHIVVTPPSLLEGCVTEGRGTFREKVQIPRLKTILLLLERSFGIDLKNADQFRIIQGTVRPDMIRQTPYNVIDLPSLNRTIDVCDEEGNRTFIFDRAKLSALHLDGESLARMEKPALDQLIDKHRGIGQALIYDTQTFVRKVAQLLDSIDESSQSDEFVDADKLLLPMADESIFSGNKIKTLLNDRYGSALDHKTVYKVAAELAEQGIVRNQSYRFGRRRVTNGYTAEEFERIHDRLKEMDMLHPKALPEDISFPGGVASLLGVTPGTVYRIASEYGLDIEQMPYRRFMSATARACRQSDVDGLFDYIAKHPLGAKKVPAGVRQERLYRLSQSELVAAVDTAAGVEAIATICNDVGIDRKQISDIDDERVNIIRNEALRRGFSYPPEGYMSLTMIGKVYEIPRRNLDRALQDLTDTLGLVSKYVYGPRPCPSYSPEQIEKIVVSARELLDDRPPLTASDRYTVAKAADQLGIGINLARKLLKAEPAEMQFNGTKSIPTYDQTVIDRLTHDERVKAYSSAQPAGEGFLSEGGIARQYGLNSLTIRRATTSLGEQLGEVKMYRFGSKAAYGYSPEQIRSILEWMDVNTRSELAKVALAQLGVVSA